MKEYVKPTLDVATLASSAPIAAKSCTGDNADDWEYVAGGFSDAQNNGDGYSCTEYTWTNGSN